MEIKQALLMPLKGILHNIWMLVLYLVSLVLFAISVNVGTALSLGGINPGQVTIIGATALFALFTLILQMYVLGVFARTVAQQEHRIQSKGFFNSIGMGFKTIGIMLPYWLVFTFSLFAWGLGALIFTIIYLILLFALAPAILMAGTRRFIDGWNPAAYWKTVWTVEYAKALGVGVIVLGVAYAIIRGLSYGVFIIASATKAGLTNYIIYTGASFVLVGLIVLYALYAYIGLFFTDAQTLGEDTAKTAPKKKEDTKPK